MKIKIEIRERPKEIHDSPCEHCPSAHYPMDEDCKEIYAMDKATRIKSIFPCAWRVEKLCKGICDVMEVSQQDVNELAERAVSS